MKFHFAIIALMGVVIPLVGATKNMLDFETFAKGNIVTSISPYGISLVAKKNTKTKVNPVYSTGIAMIFDTAAPSGGNFDLGTPNVKFGGPGQGLAGESGNTKNSVALGKVLIISECGSTTNPDNAINGGYFEFTFPEPYVLHQVGLLDNEGGTIFETWNGTNYYEYRKLGVGGENAAETLKFFDEGLGPFTKLRITLYGAGAVSFLEIEKASEVSFPCALPTDASLYSLITSRNANNAAHAMYKGMAVGGLLVDETPNESGTVDRTRSYIQAMTSQSKFNFNGGVTFNQTVPLSMYEHFAFLARNAVNSTLNGFKVVVLTKGGSYNLYHFVPGGQGEDNGKTLVIFNTLETITITGTSDGRQFGPSIIAPFANVSVSSNAGFVDGFVMAKNFISTSACGGLQLHGDTYTGQIQCRAAAPVAAPVKVPTKAPTKAPTKVPTKSPTKVPTKSPTNVPTKSPTKVPTKSPTKVPTKAPTLAPFTAPVKGPSISGDVRNGDGLTSNCMEDNWKASGKNMNLVCTAKEVSLINLKASVRSSCVIGQNYTISLNGTVQFNAARYDPAWFIAKDGGDALTGTCFVQPLLKGNLTTVDLFDAVGSVKKVGQIEWTKDFKGSNDACGDIIMNTGGGSVLQSVDIAKDLTLVCDDKNRDGVLDIGICFSWREPGADDTCNVKMVYPGAPSKCFCTRYDIPQVTIAVPDVPVDECY